MQAVTGTITTQHSPFFPSGGRNHRQYLLHRPTDQRSSCVRLSGLNNWDGRHAKGEKNQRKLSST